MHVETARDLAYSVRGHGRPELTPRPWQIQAAAETLWWLVPSAEWPAYRHGKLVFSSAQSGPRKWLPEFGATIVDVNKIFAGVNIEKGYGAVATEVDPTLRRKPDQLIDSGWLWHRLVGGPGPTQFAQMLNVVSGAATVHLYVVASYVYDRGSDAPRERDALVFDCNPAGITSILANSFPVGVLHGCETSKDFSSLAQRLRHVDAYHWIDLYAGTYVSKGDVDILQLVKGVLSHFDPWVVAGSGPERP